MKLNHKTLPKAKSKAKTSEPSYFILSSKRNLRLIRMASYLLASATRRTVLLGSGGMMRGGAYSYPAHSMILRRHIITVGRDGGNWNPIALMVPQAEEWIIERFGRFNRAAQPGLSFAFPIIDKVAYKRSLKETTIDIHPQEAITKDNVHVKLDGAVYARVVDSYKASYGIENPEYMISVLAQSAMRKEVGNLELDELFLDRTKLNAGIALALDEASQPWGIQVFRYEIANIIVDESIKDAMERQSNAERLRINQSEGDRQSNINKAQGEAESARLRAHAEADQIKVLAAADAVRTRLAAEAAADGIRSIAKAIQEEGGKDAVVQRLGELYINAIPEIAKNAKLVIIPDRPNDIAGVVTTAMSIFKTIDASIGDIEKNK
jgi:regulator of protease activity HflC (stomatin/prohibitin superfamily)